MNDYINIFLYYVVISKILQVIDSSETTLEIDKIAFATGSNRKLPE